MIRSIPLLTGGQPMTADLYVPASAAAALVVVAYGSDGLTDNLSGPWETMIRGYASSLAEKGFSVVIPDYLAVTDTKPGRPALEAMFQNMSVWQQALSDAIDQAVVVTKADPRRVGLLGFSLGGHLALRLRSKAKVLVEYFAPALAGIGSPGTLTHAQIHHGKADSFPGTGFENAGVIEDILKKEGTATERFGYPWAGHGFIGTDTANQDARDQSKTRTLAFFQAHL